MSLLREYFSTPLVAQQDIVFDVLSSDQDQGIIIIEHDPHRREDGLLGMRTNIILWTRTHTTLRLLL